MEKDNNVKKQSLTQKLGIKKTVEIDMNELDPKERPDRVGRYLKKYLRNFLFAEFSEDFLAKFKASDIMRGVPVPLRKEDIEGFAGGEGVDMLVIAENMAWVMGCDPHFKYTESYRECLYRIFNDKIVEGMLKNGRDAAEREDYDNACIHFRATLCMKPDYLHGMYSYARVCRAMYQNSSNKEYVGRFKAEALDYFELTTAVHPRHAQSYYYLGYAYLNMGYYIKADLTWRNFLRFSRNGKDKKEIRTRLEQIKEPVNIEKGYTAIMAGRMAEGVEILEPYVDTKFADWWPLHYYLGVAYKDCGRLDEAEERLKFCLRKNGSHLETMEELADIYNEKGEADLASKYLKKASLIRTQLAEEAAAREKYEAEHAHKEKDSMDYVKFADSALEKSHSKEERKTMSKEADKADKAVEEAIKKREEERKKLKGKSSNSGGAKKLQKPKKLGK